MEVLKMMFEMNDEMLEMVSGGHIIPIPKDCFSGVTDNRIQSAIGSEYDPSGLRIPPAGPQCW